MFYKIKGISPKTGKGTVSCIIRTSGFELLKSTGVVVAPADFDTASGKVKKRVVEHVELNAQIVAVSSLLEEALRNCKATFQVVTKAALEAEIAGLQAAGVGSVVRREKPQFNKEKKNLLADKIAEYLERDVNHYRKATQRGYVDLVALLAAFNPVLTLEELDVPAMQRFQKHLIEKGMRNSSIRTTMARLLTIVRFYHDERGINTSFLSKLKLVPELANDEVIYLTREEVKLLTELPLNCKAQKQIRLQFLLACETGLRHEDLVSLTHSNITGDTLTVVTRKKNTTVKPPITAAARDILAELELPAKKYHINYYNKVLRKIFIKIPAFHQEVTLTHYVGNEPTQETKPKYLLISSHVARKTAIDNWLALGVRESVVAQWAGHKNIKMIAKHYSNKEAAATTEMQKLLL
jgi:integrase